MERNGIEVENGSHDLNNSAAPSKQATTPRRKHKNNGTGFKKKVGFLRSLSDKSYLDSTGIQFQNRRLLLNCENNLHIIDGEKFRYYVGVIDFFTQFQCRQCIGKFLKDIKTCCGNHSTEHPDLYAERFYEFISERVIWRVTNKTKWVPYISRTVFTNSYSSKLELTCTQFVLVHTNLSWHVYSLYWYILTWVDMYTVCIGTY